MVPGIWVWLGSKPGCREDPQIGKLLGQLLRPLRQWYLCLHVVPTGRKPYPSSGFALHCMRHWLLTASLSLWKIMISTSRLTMSRAHSDPVDIQSTGPGHYLDLGQHVTPRSVVVCSTWVAGENWKADALKPSAPVSSLGKKRNGCQAASVPALTAWELLDVNLNKTGHWVIENQAFLPKVRE